MLYALYVNDTTVVIYPDVC